MGTNDIPDNSATLLKAFFGPSEPRYMRFDVERIAWWLAAESSAKFFMDNFPRAPNLRDTAGLLKFAAKECTIDGLNVELGVNTGTTAKIIVDAMGPGTVLHGFDSFEGLPEDWTYFQKQGRFDRKGVPPDLPPSVVCHRGWFDKTLPAFVAEHQGPVRFLHVDSDLYSSAKAGFEFLGPRIVAGTVIVFDEYFNYPGWQQHEHKAWTEFVADRGIKFEYLGWAGAATSLAVRVLEHQIAILGDRRTTSSEGGNMDTETERKKYEKMYSHDEYKAHPHSVFYAKRLLELTDWKPGDTVLDLGCGPGYASMHFKDKGLSVQAVDIAPNCLKTEHQGKFPLLISSLWELPNTVRAKWGLCADVMEHLPPDYVDDTLRTIAQAVESKCFFNICFRADGMGRLIGETLHLTVKPREWWEEKLSAYWGEVRYIDGKPNDHGNFIVGQPRRGEVRDTVGTFPMLPTYERNWSEYAKKLTPKPGEHLGDEWGTPERAAAIFRKYIEPHISSDTVAAELGVGGGKYSSKVAPRVRVLYGIDISADMLALTASRVGGKFTPVKTDGKDVAIPDRSVDFFYSFDSMVHIFPNDLFRYMEEIRRFLKPGGLAAFEFADWDSKDVIRKFMLDQSYYSKHWRLSPGAFGFIGRAAIAKMADHLGFKSEVHVLTGMTSVITLQSP